MLTEMVYAALLGTDGDMRAAIRTTCERQKCPEREVDVYQHINAPEPRNFWLDSELFDQVTEVAWANRTREDCPTLTDAAEQACIECGVQYDTALLQRIVKHLQTQNN